MAKRSNKPVKTEALQVRFDPMLKWAAEIAAGRERRTLSSLLEWSTERMVKELPAAVKGDQAVTVWQVVEQCWHANQSDRLLNLKQNYPELLTYEERLICNSAHVAMQFNIPHRVSTAFEPIILEAVWPFVLQHAEGKIETPLLWMECRKAAAWLIEDSGCNTANLLRGLAHGELSPAEFASRLNADTSAKEQLLSILGEP